MISRIRGGTFPVSRSLGEILYDHTQRPLCRGRGAASERPVPAAGLSRVITSTK